MIPIYDSGLIQIEVTNACNFKCAHCSRGIPHIKNPLFANLEFIEKSLISLKGWKKAVGCHGGEPTLHPNFVEICKLYKRYFPKNQCALYTSGGKDYLKYENIIKQTFEIILLNDHKKKENHQPIMIAIEEVIDDISLRNKLIENCWLQQQWSPIITLKGAFFCEVAATFDLLFNGPGGYPIESGWWNKSPEDFKDQKERYCKYCSVAIPMKDVPSDLPFEYVSEKNAQRLIKAESPLAKNNRICVVNDKIKRELINQKFLKGKINEDQSKFSKEVARNFISGIEVCRSYNTFFNRKHKLNLNDKK